MILHIFPRLIVFLALSILLYPELPATLQAQEVDTSSNLTIHVVQRGENLFRIALQYNTTIQELADINGIRDVTSIQVGQRLLVPALQGDVTLLPATHIVQPGESLMTIAQAYELELDFLISLNELSNPNRIYPGQVLRIIPENREPVIVSEPSSLPAVEVSSNHITILHTIQSGETLFRIAAQYGLTTTQVAEANNISDPTQIYAGQQLLIPSSALNQVDVDLPFPIIEMHIAPLFFVEGQTGTLQWRTSEPATFSGNFLEKSLNVVSKDNNTFHTALLSIPVFTPSDIYPLSLNVERTNNTLGAITINIRILSGNYGTQSLTISGELTELLAPAVEEYELSLLARITSPITQVYFQGPLSLPAAAPMNSPFGTVRSYNGGPFDRYHNGVDFATIPGTPVMAAGDGRVVLVDLLNIRGNTVVIDHGRGVYTVYSHMAELYVPLGTAVSTGQIIGTSGSTGRVTGAHLHWEVWVNGVAVNPMQWVQSRFP